MVHERELRLAARRAIALVLAGGRGSRLKQLTDRRAKPAVHFGGKFRIIDFALSNCINSGFRRISVVTQYKSHSLLVHLQRGWNWMRGEMGEYVDFLPAQQRIDETTWYQGTADAVYQNLDILKSRGADWVLILAGDHVYKMDYAAMLAEHIDSGADVTVPCVEVPRMQATGFGVMHVDEDDRVISFLEKPADPPAIPGKPDRRRWFACWSPRGSPSSQAPQAIAVARRPRARLRNNHAAPGDSRRRSRRGCAGV